MKKILCFILLAGLKAGSQTLTPQVINAAGNHSQLGASNVYITDNVGEPFTEMHSNATLSMMISQGFLQPGNVSPGGFQPLLLVNQPKCADRFDDASISVAINATVSKYTVRQYIWSSTAKPVCPANTCSSVYSLNPGSYNVRIVVDYTTQTGMVKTDTLNEGPVSIVAGNEVCRVKIYNAVTPNKDGVNDFWTIEGITEFPNNEVTIYNRWGDQMAKFKGYDNAVKSWPNTNDLFFLVSSTYFYVIDLKDGGPVIKGWVEVIKSE